MTASRPLLARALAWLAPALVLGVVAMHSMVSFQTASHHESMSMAAPVAMAAADHHAHAATAMTHDSAVQPGHQGGSSGGMVDCSGLMTMCLAVLLALGAMLLARLQTSSRLLHQLPRAGLVALGEVRDAFQALTPRERSAVIRC